MSSVTTSPSSSTTTSTENVTTAVSNEQEGIVGAAEEKENEEPVVEERQQQGEEKGEILEARQIYILMSKEYRISRNRRAEWFFSTVNSCISYPPDEPGQEETDGEKEEDGQEKGKDGGDKQSTDFEVVSIIPVKEPPAWNFEQRHSYRYRVSPDTKIVYLSRRYRIVFCLDISPSVASVDVQSGGVVFDSIFKALQASLYGLLQPFQIPGSRRSFRPEIFLTVIAHTPFFTPVTNQVLLQGQLLDKDTCSEIIRELFERLNDIENKIADLLTKRVQELSTDSSDLERLAQYNSDGEDETDGRFLQQNYFPATNDNTNGTATDAPRRRTNHPSNTHNKYSSFIMSPDFGLLDLLRQALIALSLMPENSSAGLVILTDGVISVPDGRYLDIILSQLRYNTVSCSFIQLSSPFHPHLCHGVLPYADLMKFIASATFGAYLSEAPEITDTGDAGMNVYHNAFLAWSFHKTLQTEWTKQRVPARVKPGEWSVRNKCFFSVRDMPIVKKQQYENILSVDHMKVMSCRLREGFTIKEVITSPETGLLEVTLILPWKFLIHLEYKICISSRGEFLYDDISVSDSSDSGKVRCVVSLEGPYDFLHDVTCLAKKPFSSLYRQLMVNRFWATRKNLSESDRLLVHLNSFSSNPSYYNIPESLKNGVPLFYWGSVGASATPQLQTNEQTYPQFTQFWKPVCLLDTTVWQKWMHTHRIGVILEHDYPLPKNLHLPNSTGRFNVIQCRQAVMALNTLLKNMSSFALLENQSYVRLMFKTEEDRVPHSFCLIRVTSKPPHVVLRLAFLVGTPGHLRHQTVALFREKIASLTFPQRVKDPPKWRVIVNTPVAAKVATTASPLVNKTSWSDMPCCVLVHKPVEKILIRYDKSPEDFRRRLFSVEETNMYVPKSKSAKQSTFGFRPTYQTAPVVGNTTVQMLPEVFNTIARYLYHRRWIWWFPGGELPPLNVKWASEILATVTKMRLQEGFRFAYSSSGITNMVLELPMKNEGSQRNSGTPMVLQFLVFPPTSNLKQEFEDLDFVDTSNSLYLVTECWVEPQCGKVTEDGAGSDNEDIPVVAKNYLGLNYNDIPTLLFNTDQTCISLVGTFEYLVRICSHKDASFSMSINQATSEKPEIEENESIEVVPFEFDLKQILKRSGQVEILFSSFFQDLSLTFPTEWNKSVCEFFERANDLLYSQWCANIAIFQDKEVKLTSDQHAVVTRAVLLRKGLGLEEGLEEGESLSKSMRGQRSGIQWRCFVRSNSSTHVLLTLLPATLRDAKTLLLQVDVHTESVHKTRSCRYVDFLDSESNNLLSVNEAVMECPNKVAPSAPIVTSAGTSSSPQLVNHDNCQNCQGSATAASIVSASSSNRKRVRAFSGGSECSPAVKKYLSTPAPVGGSAASSSHSGDEGDVKVPSVSSEADGQEQSQDTPASQATTAVDSDDDKKTRSQTFSEGTVRGKLAHFIRAKRTLSDQSGGTGSGEQEQENLCSDPQRCSQLYDFLNRCGAAANGTVDDSLRYVPCRPPVVGSLALCVFTYSCSLMQLTDHVVFSKVSTDELTKDYRVTKEAITGFGVINAEDFDMGTGDDDDDLSEPGSVFPNGRSISQESFSESSLQRLEAAEHESLLKSHCGQLKDAHLQAYILSAYRSLLSGFHVNPCDVQVIIDRCALTRVKFPLNTFLQYVCRHKKAINQVLADFRNADEEQGETEMNDKESPTDAHSDDVDVDDVPSRNKSPVSSCADCCRELETIHQFIKKRFRKLLSRHFTSATENGHVLFYKFCASNALSEFSTFGGGPGGLVKCSSDLEDNIDSCSIAADSLCSGDDLYPMSSLHIPSDNETTADRSPHPLTDRRRVCSGNTVNDADAQSNSGFTQASLLGSSVNCAPLFCYLSCAFKTVQDEDADEEQSDESRGEDLRKNKENDDEECIGYTHLTDIPTCYHDLCLKYIELVADGGDPEDELELTPTTSFQITMELTFLTCPDSVKYGSTSNDSPHGSNKTADTSSDSSGSGRKYSDMYKLSLPAFQKRITPRQANAIDHIIRDINWLMEDEVMSFRGGGGGPGSGTIAVDEVDVPLLEQVSSHVLRSLEKMGCVHQQIRLSFVEHGDGRGFQSFLEKFNGLSVNEYKFQKLDSWWYLVVTPRQSPDISGSSAADEGSPSEKSTVPPSSSSSSSPPSSSVPALMLPPFWIILKAENCFALDLYHHCRYDENDIATLQFSRNLRNRIIDNINELIRTINQDLLLQQLHDSRVCSSLLEAEDVLDLEEVPMEIIVPVNTIGSMSHFGNSESDISSTLPIAMFMPGMFSCRVVWVTTFNLHSRLRSGGGKTAFLRGIQTLRSTLTAFEVINRKNMFVYRDALGNVFYMRFYRGVDLLDGSTGGSPSKILESLGGTTTVMDDYPESEIQSIVSDSSSVNRILLKRQRNQDSESEKNRDDPCDGVLALKVHGIVSAGEEIKEQLVQSLRNKLDDAVLDILCVTLKRNPHCKLTPDDVHFLQEPRSRPVSVFRFKLARFIVAGHLPAFSYYLHQNLLQFLTIPKYTSVKAKYHFQDYSRLQQDHQQDGGGNETGSASGVDSSVYLYNQSPGGGGTGNRGIAVVSMALTDRYGSWIRNPDWKQPEMGTECDLKRFGQMIETCEITKESETEIGDNTVMVEFNMWKQGRINVELLKNNVYQAIKQAGWDLIMEFKVMTAPLAVLSQQETADEEGVFDDNLSGNEDQEASTVDDKQAQQERPGLELQKRRSSSHLNPSTTRSNSTSAPLDDDDEPRTRSMSFTGLRKPGADGDATSQTDMDRAPSPVPLTSGRGASEGSRPRILLSRSQSAQMSLSPEEIGEVGNIHPNYTSLLDSWLENGNSISAPALRRIKVSLNCRYPVPCIVQELEKIINQIAPDNAPKQFWRHAGEEDYVSYVGSSGGTGTGIGGLGSITGVSMASTTGAGRRDSGGQGAGNSVSYGCDEYSLNNSEVVMLKKQEKDLLALEHTEEAEYPAKMLNLFRKNENFNPGHKGHVCYLIARNLAHWKSCMNGDVDFALHSTQDFKNLYKYPPLLNENLDMEGSRGSIEKLPRANFSRGEFVLWTNGKAASDRVGKNSSPILIPRQRFLRARVTTSEVDFVVYNWSKECCERLQEHVTYLSHWIQARASLLSSLLLQKSGIFYCQPILADNFACSAESTNPFITGDVDIKDLILNTPPTGKHERRSHHHHHPPHHPFHHQHHPHPGGGIAGGGPGAMSRLMSKLGMNVPGGLTPPSHAGSGSSPSGPIVSSAAPSSTSTSKPVLEWSEFYRNISLCHMLGMPEPTGENPVDAHGKQLFHVLNVQNGSRESENAIFQYWLTRGPSASNVITTQMLESFTRTARTIHFCLTPVMFLPTWRAAVAQTRDSSSVGGILRKNRTSSRKFFQPQAQNHALHAPPQTSKLTLPPPSVASSIQAQRMRHGSEISQASSLASLRNRSKSYHSGMMNLILHPETISEKDFETGCGSGAPSPQQIQQQALFLKVKSEEPWHGVVCKIFIQEYMQYLQTLGFVPVHCKAGSVNQSGVSGSVGGISQPIGLKRVGAGVTSPGPRESPKPKLGTASPAGIQGGSIGMGAGGPSSPTETEGEEDERMINFLQRCLPGGIIVIEVGLVPPFFYCKIHALEAKRIFPLRNSKSLNSSLLQKNAIQFVDECEKMKVLTHLHSFMYDFHLRSMFLYISGRQQLFKVGYHITTFLDDFITYYPKCPNFSRNAVHIGVVNLEDVVTPSQVLFNYILGHDKLYRMKVIRMAPFNPITGVTEDTSWEYVLVHNMSRKVSYRSSDRGGDDNPAEPPPQTLDEFDLTLVIAHDYASSSRDLSPNSSPQGLRVKYYIVLTSRRDLYPKGDSGSEPNSGKLCPVNTPAPLCARHSAHCPASSSCVSGMGIMNKYASPPPAPPPSYFDGFEGHHHFHGQAPPPLQHHTSLLHSPMTPRSRPAQLQNQQTFRPAPDMIREEKVRYMGYFSSHEQLMQKIINEQKDTMEQFIRQLITKASIDCRRDLLWERLLVGSPPQTEIKLSKGNSNSRLGKSSIISATSSASSTQSAILSGREDAISRETMGPLSYVNFNELLGLVQVVPLNKLDPRLDELLRQPVNFYQILIKVLVASTNSGSPGSVPKFPVYNYSEYVSPDQKIHQLAIFTPDAHKSIVMVEVNMEETQCDIYVVVKDGKKGGEMQPPIPTMADLGVEMYALVEKVVNACCYATWTTLI